MAITHLRHVGILSPDLNKQREFYSTIWGLDQISQENDAVYFRGASAEHHLLSLHSAQRCGLHHIAFGVSNIDYIQDEASHEPKIWPRTPELIDRWGTAGPPGADIRHAMEGKPDPGWQA